MRQINFVGIECTLVLATIAALRLLLVATAWNDASDSEGENTTQHL